jgi:hypothetical protein
MAARYSRHVALTEPLTRFVDRQVTDGRYASAGEVVRAALRLLERQGDGPGVPNDPIDPDGGLNRAHAPAGRGSTGA